VRYEHYGESFASKFGTQNMVPPYSVLRPSGVKTTRDNKKGESIICKLATIPWVKLGRCGLEEEFK